MRFRSDVGSKEVTMWLYFFLAVFVVLAIGGGTWGRSHYGNWGWSPALIIVVVGLVLYFTGHLSFRG